MTYGSTFPAAASAFAYPSPWYSDVIVSTLSANGGALLESNRFGGYYSDYGYALAPSRTGGLLIAGSTEAPYSTFLTTSGAVQPSFAGWIEGFVVQIDNVLPPDQARNGWCACLSIAKPVNTRTGNFWTSATDLSVQTPGPSLTWSRIYNSRRSPTPRACWATAGSTALQPA